MRYLVGFVYISFVKRNMVVEGLTAYNACVVLELPCGYFICAPPLWRNYSCSLKTPERTGQYYPAFRGIYADILCVQIRLVRVHKLCIIGKAKHKEAEAGFTSAVATGAAGAISGL